MFEYGLGKINQELYLTDESAGSRIVDEIQKYDLDCIAHKAYSMGFVILQACNKRYITQYSSVMQHQISYGVSNEIKLVRN